MGDGGINQAVASFQRFQSSALEAVGRARSLTREIRNNKMYEERRCLIWRAALVCCGAKRLLFFHLAQLVASMVFSLADVVH